MASVIHGPNTVIFKEDWAATLQAELDEPTKFEEICRVEFANAQTFNNPYLTDPSVTTLSPGTAYTFSSLVRTNETAVVNQHFIVPQVIDRMDLGLSGYDKQMGVAKRQAVLLKEQIETVVYADHGSLTNFGAGDITGGSVADTTQITVSETNIDDIITHLVRVIRVANGESLLERNGGFVVWRPADFQKLQTFAMANGYNTADAVLKAGLPQGFYYGGLYHFTSNLLTANHVIAGVKKAYYVGIYQGTYGQIMVDDKDPNLYSGVSVVSRVDFAVKCFTKVKPVLFDVNVA